MTKASLPPPTHLPAKIADAHLLWCLAAACRSGFPATCGECDWYGRWHFEQKVDDERLKRAKESASLPRRLICLAASCLRVPACLCVFLALPGRLGLLAERVSVYAGLSRTAKKTYRRHLQQPRTEPRRRRRRRHHCRRCSLLGKRTSVFVCRVCAATGGVGGGDDEEEELAMFGGKKRRPHSVFDD